MFNISSLNRVYLLIRLWSEGNPLFRNIVSHFRCEEVFYGVYGHRFRKAFMRMINLKKLFSWLNVLLNRGISGLTRMVKPLTDLGVEAAAILSQVTRPKKCIGLYCYGAWEFRGPWNLNALSAGKEVKNYCLPCALSVLSSSATRNHWHRLPLGQVLCTSAEETVTWKKTKSSWTK